MNKGTLVVISGFSGAGKGTVLSQVLARRPDLYFSVSFTTRPPREGEKDGVNYHFVTRQAFQERIERRVCGEFLRNLHGGDPGEAGPGNRRDPGD